MIRLLTILTLALVTGCASWQPPPPEPAPNPEPCQTGFRQRDVGLVVGSTGIVLGGTAGLVAAARTGESRSARITEGVLVGAGVLAAGAGLVAAFDDDSPHTQCVEPQPAAGDQTK